MQYFYLSVILSILYIIFSIYTAKKQPLQKQTEGIAPLVLVLVLGFLLRTLFALNTKGYGTDMSCFASWSYNVYETGFREFYSSIGFCDYPPGYLYILYLLGGLTKLFGFSYQSAGANLLLKLPAILCDMALILSVYRFAKQEKANSVFIPLLLALSPALIMTSAIWGQIDSILAVLTILCFLYAIKGRLEWSALFFTLAALVKPQAFMFAPLVMILFALHDKVMFGLFAKRDLSKGKTIALNYLLTFGFSACLFYLFSIPFYGWNSIPGLIEKYYSTFSSYAYATVNALNLNFLFGGNWADLNTPFLLLNYGAWGSIFIVVSVVVAMYLLYRTKEKKAIFLTAGILLLSIYTLGSKMHERYFFLCILLFAFAYLVHKRKELLILFSGISVTYFLNVVLAYIDQVNHIPKDSGYGMIISILHLLLLAYAYITYFRIYPFEKRKDMKQTKKVQGTLPYLNEKKTKKIVHIDYMIMAVITLIYGILAFVNLGDFSSPQTGTVLKRNDVVELTLAPASYDAMMVFEGMDLGDIDITGSTDGITFETISKFEKRNVFSWKRFELKDTYEKIRLTVTKTDNQNIELKEIGFVADGGIRKVAPEQITLNGKPVTELNDEQSLVPEYPTFQNGTYFDEIYHARTAYEFNHDLTIYENTHPQLGKMIMALGVKLFGMTPFGYRSMGTLFGILMLPILYIFIKRIFKSSFISTIGTLLFAFDFMHFTQTRIATIDVFIVFFIILMYYFMYQFYDQSKSQINFKKQVLYLFLSGLMFGFGIASKWTGAYAGIGLALIYLLALRNIYKQSKTEGKSFGGILSILLGCGVGFFVIIPALIYFVCYIPYFICMNDPVNMDSFMRINTHMFNYHSKLNDTHPFASKWYQWILDIKPIWYYQSINPYDTGMKGTIAAFGNPLVWIGGFAALLYMIKDTIKNKSNIGLFIFIAYIVQIIPWIPVAEARTTFIYHYFPAVPFLILGICYVIDRYLKKKENSYRSVMTICGLTAAALVVFILYYPILSGLECSTAYINAMKLFPTWIF